MAVRCEFCHTLIIHRLNGMYNRRDYRRKRLHEQTCNANPVNVKRDIRFAQIKANLLSRWINNG